MNDPSFSKRLDHGRSSHILDVLTGRMSCALGDGIEAVEDAEDNSGVAAPDREEEAKLFVVGVVSTDWRLCTS